MRVFIIAGEASGDNLGAALMAGLHELHPGVEFAGIGGVAMQGQGMDSLFAMDELSLMGLVEILPKYLHLKRRISETAEAALAFRPDVVLSIDAPDFCLRVARLIKAKSDVKTVHYVAPSVWAWRPKRADKMAQVIDHVLTLLPFEPPYMQEAGMGADFVGHPVVAEPVATGAEVAAFRTQSGLGDSELLLLLPGSRRGEISRLLPIFKEVVARLHHERPDLRAVMPLAPGTAAIVREAVQDWPQTPVLITPEDAGAKRAAFKAADAALAASGTVTLELAASATPMLVAYDFNWLTWIILKRMVKIDSVCLVNLVSDTRIVPEFLGDRCRAELIAPALNDLLNNPSGQQAAMKLTMAKLGKGGEPPGLWAARALLEVVKAP